MKLHLEHRTAPLVLSDPLCKFEVARVQFLDRRVLKIIRNSSELLYKYNK